MIDGPMNVWLGFDNNVQAEIDSVIASEDRAQVFRRGKVEKIGPGTVYVACGPLSPVIADKTVRCRSHNPRARVLDVQVKRRYLHRLARPEDEKRLRDELERQLWDYEALRDDISCLAHEYKSGREARESLLEQLRQRVLFEEFTNEQSEEFDYLFKRMEDIEKDYQELNYAQQDQRLNFSKLRAEWFLAHKILSSMQAACVIELSLEQEMDVELELQYLVPCAIWRPSYRADLLEGEVGEEGQLDWRSRAVLWQNSGEDWNSVKLSFSTRRPSLGACSPVLQTDSIDSREKSEREKTSVTVESRQETVEKLNRQDESKESCDTPPGIDDGGQVRLFSLEERVDVLSDGMPRFFELGCWSSRVSTQWLCSPELARYAYLRSRQVNPSKQPCLAGPVDLVRNSMFVGRSEIGYVESGETFELAWGSDDELVVWRDLQRKSSQKGLRKRKVERFELKIRLQNFSAGSKELTLCERIPVSELEQVEVRIDDKNTTPEYKVDENGILQWELAFAIAETKVLELCYEVEMPQNVVWNG